MNVNLIIKDEHVTLEKNLEETSVKLRDTIVNRDKMSSNFDETEKLYVERIKNTQNELQNTYAKLHQTSKQWVTLFCQKFENADANVT